jgi:DNA-binding winged helix-turn-helix (wHTH) protein
MLGEAYRFGEFRFTPRAMELTRGGTLLKLSQAGSSMLQALLIHRPNALTKDTLMKAIWGRIMDEGYLYKVASELRDALGESDHPRLIVTVPREGYRFAGDAETVAESTGSREEQTSYRRLGDRLTAWQWGPIPVLADDNARRRFGSSLIMQDVIWDAAFNGWAGVNPDHLRIERATAGPQLPEYVWQSKRSIDEPKDNGRKAYLEHWDNVILDKDRAAVTLRIGQYDYWTTCAVRTSAESLHRDLLTGHVQLDQIARRLDWALVVVTSDDKLVLTKRSDRVDNDQGHWMASVGESVDPAKDVTTDLTVDPRLTLRRCLTEADELNLPARVVGRARTRILGLASEFNLLYVNLIGLVELPIVYDEVVDHFQRRGEHLDIAPIDFNPDSCLQVLRKGHHASDRYPVHSPLVPVSALGLVFALIHRFGFDEVTHRIG